MTTATKYAPRLPAMPAAVLIGALALAGCSSGNVGESWQCPLAKGGTCNSVAAADPAVPDAGTAGRTVLKEPLWRVRPSEPASRPQMQPCEADCGGFDPFGWLMRLFGAGEGDDTTATQDAGPRTTAHFPPEIPPATASEASAPDAAASYPVTVKTASRAREPKTASLPAEPARGAGDPGGDDLRTDEVVARIWIAPFVDADGVYREASHVRVVLEPAGWRLGR